MPDRSTRRLTTRLAGLVLAACLAACGGDAGIVAARNAAEAGDHAQALALYQEAIGPESVAEDVYDAALSALAAGDPDAAAQHLTSVPVDLRPLGARDFLAGNVAFALCVRAQAQALAPEAEPFAFDIALRLGRDARDAWQRAAAHRDDWPAARRNVERALEKLDELAQQKAEADRNRKNPRAGSQARNNVLPGPKPGEKPKPGEDSTDQSPDGDPGTTARAETAELSEEQVARLLEVLAAKESEKRALRRKQRESRRAEGENAW